MLTGGAGDDFFIFHAGKRTATPSLTSPATAQRRGMSCSSVGFGTAAGGATFTQIGATNQWQIHSGLDAHNEIITLSATARQSTRRISGSSSLRP